MTNDQEGIIPEPDSYSMNELFVFAENPEPRWPCVLLLDNSRSMRENNAIGMLNDELRTFKSDLKSDEVGNQRVELAVVTFGNGVELVQDFAKVGDFVLPVFEADGTDLDMAGGIHKALEIVETRKKLYANEVISYFIPMVVLMTGGERVYLTEDLIEGVVRSFGIEDYVNFAFFGVRLQGADGRQVDNLISGYGTFHLEDLPLHELFGWLRSEQFDNIIHFNRSSGTLVIDAETLKAWDELQF